MSIIDRILGRTASEGPQIQAPPKGPTSTAAGAKVGESPPGALAPPVPAAAVPEGVIRVYDQFGRTVSIGREAWRRDVLLPNLQSNRGNPDALYDLIVGALDDEFAADVLDAARHLADTDPKPPRGATVLGVVLLQLEDFSGAREVLERAIARYGENPYLLANLARAWAALGDDARAQALIWRALELDPNEPTSLNWLIANLQQRGGAAAVLAAYARAAALPGSWRAQLWLARDALERGDLPSAQRLFVVAQRGPCPPTC